MFPNWIIDNLNNALDTWNDKLVELWSLISETPQDFKGGDIWEIMVSINEGLKGVGYGLLILFTAMSIFGSTMDFRDFKRPEHALRHFVRFACAKIAIGHAMELLTMIFSICGGVVANMAGYVGGASGAAVHMPIEIANAIDDVGLFKSVPLWLVSILGSLFIVAMSFIMIMTVYSRFFKLYMHVAFAPLPLACFTGPGTAAHGKQFIKSFVAVCIEGGVVVLACVIFGAFVNGEPMLPTGDPFVVSFSYIAEVIFDMLVLVGLIKAGDRIVKEMFGL